MSKKLEDKVGNIQVFSSWKWPTKGLCDPEKGDFFSSGALKWGLGDFWEGNLNFVGCAA